MENDNNFWGVVAGAIAVVLGALKLPDLYKALSKKEVFEQELDCKTKIMELELKNKQMRTAFEMLLVIIENGLDDATKFEPVIKKVKTLIKE